MSSRFCFHGYAVCNEGTRFVTPWEVNGESFARETKMTTNPNHQRESAPSAVAFEPFSTKPEVARTLGKRVRTIDNCGL